MPASKLELAARPSAQDFSKDLAHADPEVNAAIQGELRRLKDEIELIASENIVSPAVMEAQGSVLINRTVEGYPGGRYHSGTVYADALEQLAINRATQLFGCGFANVQPHSGSQANQVVFAALLEPGDPVVSMTLETGGHLSHGAAPNIAGKWFDVAQYGVRRQDGLIDYEEAERLTRGHKPKLIITGGSSYPLVIDFARFRRMADEVGATFLVDMAHFAGLVAGGVYPSPFPHAHIVTTTTYKNLRGPRGALILTDDAGLAKKIDAALIPGVQGSTHINTIAAKAVCLGEALKPEFKAYAWAVLENARALAETLADRGLLIVNEGTDMPMLLVDLRPLGLTGDVASDSLEAAGLTCNKNLIPFDPEKAAVTSGLRLGASAGTSRGFLVEEFRLIGNLIADVLDGLVSNGAGNGAVEDAVRTKVRELCQRFPIYPDL